MSVRHLMTAEELWELPEKPGGRHELVDGELVEMPGAGASHNLIAALVYELVRDVEVVSANDRADDVHDKVEEYLDAGARLVWALWPRRRSVSTHTPGRVARELGPDDMLDAGDVLPGFRGRVAELFDVRGSR